MIGTKFPEDDDDYGYRVVLADPPWLHRSNSQAAPGRNPRRHYPCLTVAQLCTLPLAERLAKDAVLFLCVPGPQLAIGAHVPLMKAWGFKPAAIGFVWVKLNPNAASRTNFSAVDLCTGPGHTTRKNCEFVLIGKRGRSLRRDCGVHEVIIAPRREHSRKPDELYRRIERYAEGPYIELFARESRPGWITWGAERTKFDPPGAIASPLPGGVP